MKAISAVDTHGRTNENKSESSNQSVPRVLGCLIRGCLDEKDRVGNQEWLGDLQR